MEYEGGLDIRSWGFLIVWTPRGARRCKLQTMTCLSVTQPGPKSEAKSSWHGSLNDTSWPLWNEGVTANDFRGIRSSIHLPILPSLLQYEARYVHGVVGGRSIRRSVRPHPARVHAPLIPKRGRYADMRTTSSPMCRVGVCA